MNLRFMHMGVAVADLAQGREVYEKIFGCRFLSGPFDDPLQQVSVCFLAVDPGGKVEVELVAPLAEASPIRRWLAKGGGPYHLCYETDDLDATIALLSQSGCLVVATPVPAVAFGGRRIAWLYSPLRQLFELVERELARGGEVPAGALPSTTSSTSNHGM
jgi:methylmalonyl-CoA/ethylmalonyl-CoA epimerase